MMMKYIPVVDCNKNMNLLFMVKFGELKANFEGYYGGNIRDDLDAEEVS